MALSLRIIITSFLFITATASSPPGGFTVGLFHRRSNSSSSPLSRTSDDDGSSPYADTVFATSAYLMKLQIGTPPVEIEAILDTGSDLIWTQCLPCVNCDDHQQAPTVFDPSKSSSYKAKICDDGPCPYTITYADQTYSVGTLATETVTVKSTSGQPFVMPETSIGCGHNNTAQGLISNSSGIVGLGLGSSSLISQMGEIFLGLFSYCLSGQGTSKINFGGNAIVSGDGTVAADMFRKPDNPGFYYLNLDAVSVGDNRVETLGTPFHASDGNIIIDSGTTLTYFPESYCKKVKQAVENVMPEDRVDFMGDMLCYHSDNIEMYPSITLHFSGGADLVLEKYNTYMSQGGVYCLAIMCADPIQDPIFGNRAQNNLLVGYDPSSLLISFKATDCSSLWS
ncbi:unnamed protein product [Microthlaspi erraticum]|uniref:Peptidase A1 domain-containing protein n=1 Tax=Microthlaspi erraticum TaxID=1685480 RepID=A0A6D2KAN5_9BRAS|nr:unnamed protein product [Microthlaspi erraticum]